MTVAFGSFTYRGKDSLGVRVGDAVLPLGAIARDQSSPLTPYFDASNLDRVLDAPASLWPEIISTAEEWARLYADDALPFSDVRFALPFTVGDYVDFFSSRTHAENLGTIMRPGQPALQPNWLRIPIAYHGRSGTVIPSGTPVTRPRGHMAGADGPVFAPSAKLDVEVEVGFVIGGTTPMGSPVSTADAEDHIFGVILVNDWSARDIQAYEYVPLGPMLAKSFATSVGWWVHPLASFGSARVAPPAREEPIHRHLQSVADWGLDITLELSVNNTTLSRPRFCDMYWTPDQQLAHLTSNGAGVRSGDLFASGTVSSAQNWGSLIELTRNGAEPLLLSGGDQLSFLRDGDEVVISATVPAADGSTLSLGEIRTRIRPAEFGEGGNER